MALAEAGETATEEEISLLQEKVRETATASDTAVAAQAAAEAAYNSELSAL
jgi:hypothetical protein